MKSNHQPLVSIIIATYNRSNVLKLAIESVLWSTYQNWELIVVDDASTDDTSFVVNSFSDKRIKYFVLKENIGVQSGPNNEGLKHARGEFIAYLSHDDIWFPDHLENLVSFILKSNSDWVFSLAFNVISNTKITISGIFPFEKYDPKYGYVVASMWLLKKEVLQELGDWKLSFETRLIPSQELLLRAYNAGKQIMMSPNSSVLVFPSGSRKNCYTDGSAEEQSFYIDQIKSDNHIREQLLKKAYIYDRKTQILNSFQTKFIFKRLLIAILKNTGLLFRISPIELSALIKYRKRGSYINKIRRRRGLVPIDKPK